MITKLRMLRLRELRQALVHGMRLISMLNTHQLGEPGSTTDVGDEVINSMATFILNNLDVAAGEPEGDVTDDEVVAPLPPDSTATTSTNVSANTAQGATSTTDRATTVDQGLEGYLTRQRQEKDQTKGFGAHHEDQRAQRDVQIQMQGVSTSGFLDSELGLTRYAPPVGCFDCRAVGKERSKKARANVPSCLGIPLLVI